MNEDQTNRNTKRGPDTGQAPDLVFSTIFPPRVSAGRKHTYIERLSQLRDAQETALTPEEYQAWRSCILDELATFSRLSLAILITIGLCGAGSVTMTVVGFINHSQALTFAGIGSFVGGLFIGYGMSRDAATKRNLTEQDRLAAISELLSARLVSEHEATALKERVEQLFRNDRSDQPR